MSFKDYVYAERRTLFFSHFITKGSLDWLVLLESMNPDQLPDAFYYERGCQVCGASFVEITHVAIPAEKIVQLLIPGSSRLSVLGVMLLCSEQHHTAIINRHAPDWHPWEEL